MEGITARDNADGRRHLDDALLAVLAQDSRRCASRESRAARLPHASVFFDDFVGDIAESGLFHGRARQRFRVFGGRLRAGFHNRVDLFLGKFREFFLCGGGCGPPVRGLPEWR